MSKRLMDVLLRTISRLHAFTLVLFNAKFERLELTATIRDSDIKNPQTFFYLNI